VTHGDQSSIEGGLDGGGGLMAAFLTVALTPAATAAAVLGTKTGACKACDVMRVGGGLAGRTSEPSSWAEGGVKTGAKAVSFGDEGEVAGCGCW
jgi:hypothetical protein